MMMWGSYFSYSIIVPDKDEGGFIYNFYCQGVFL